MKFKSFYLTLLAVGALFASSCSQENDIDAEGNRGKGEATYASFSFTLDNGVTRTADANADPVETKVGSVKLFIFSGSQLESVETPNLNVMDTEPVETTTGQKTIYVVAPADIPFADGFSPVAGTTTLAQFEAALTQASASVIAKANTFLMAGGKQYVITKCTKDYAKAHPVSITLTRSAAKMQLAVAADAQVRPTVNASFTKFSFGIAQPSLTMPLLAGDTRYTPKGDKTEGSSVYSNFAALPSDYTGFYVDAVSAFSNSAANSRYCGENFQASDPVSGNTTFALVRSQAIPTSVYKGVTLTDGTFWVVALNNKTTASWVFLQGDNGSQLYFASQEAAEAYMAENDINNGITDADSQWKAYEYVNGMCYYRLNILTDQDANHAANLRYRVMRNTFYRATIDKIDALGAPTPGGVVPEDPDQPVEASAWLVCSLDLAPWTVCDMDDQVLN